MSASTSPSERPCTLAPTVTTFSRSRWSICAGPTLCVTVATCSSEITAGHRPGRRAAARAAGCAGRRRACALRATGAPSRRASRRTDRPSRRRRPRRTPAAAPARSGAVVRPSEPATPRLISTSSSGFWPRVDRPTSTAPGTAGPAVASCSASSVMRLASGPRTSSWICLNAPPKPLVNTYALAPPMSFHFIAQHRAQAVLADVALALRDHPHVDACATSGEPPRHRERAPIVVYV